MSEADTTALAMNGAEALVRTLLNSGVDTCFTNPGTSEMHFVAALDRNPGMRCVLGLFEGVVTGAADGYFRMARKPAATLLHLAPGLGNGLANLHNAKKAQSGIVNIVGDHATYHLQYDAPLTGDVNGVARPMSDWVQTAATARDVPLVGARAVAAARSAPGQIATLILPANTAWEEAGSPSEALAPVGPATVDQSVIESAAQTIRNGRKVALLLGGEAVRGEALEMAGRIAAKTGCTLLAEYQNARLERGAGRVAVTRLPYTPDANLAALQEFSDLILIGSKQPVSFFAYPGKPSVLTPEGCNLMAMAGRADDLPAALSALADNLGATTSAPAFVAPLDRPSLPSGAITLDGIAAVIANLLPEHAIVIDEAVSSGRGFPPLTATAAPHDWICSMGGSIGYGLPFAIGAAMACPDRRVVALEGDGSAMYTVQALWTMARERLNVTTIVFANRAYKILRGELASVGVETPGRNAIDMLTLDDPALDWVAIAKGHGVEARRIDSLEQLAEAVRWGFATRGPNLIEIIL